MKHLALLLLAVAASLPAAAQVARNFPQDALRGEITVVNPPDVLVNGRVARLAPGARIRGQDNMLKMSSALAGQRFAVHYTIDTLGLVKDVWMLRTEETRGLWPKTQDEARAWSFDPIAQTWAKP